jgi:hypothetical protein
MAVTFASWFGFFAIFVEIAFGGYSTVVSAVVVVLAVVLVDSPDVVVLPGFFDPPCVAPDPLAVWPLEDPPPLVLAVPVVGFPAPTPVGFPPPLDACEVTLGPVVGLPPLGLWAAAVDPTAITVTAVTARSEKCRICVVSSQGTYLSKNDAAWVRR